MPTWALVWVRRFKSPSWRLFFVLLAFVAGTAVHSFIDIPLPTEALIWTIVVVVGLLFLLPFYHGRNKMEVIFITLLVAALVGGLLRYALSFPTEQGSIAEMIGREIRVQGTVVNDPEQKESRQEIVLDEVFENGEERTNKLIAWIPKYPELHYGDLVSFRCEVERPEPYDGFAYDRYLLVRGIVATCFSHDEPLIRSSGGGHPLRRILFRWRNGFEDLLAAALPSPHNKLAAGLLLGIKELPDDLEEAFRQTGVSHIVAASGYNVGIVLTIMLGSLACLMRRQRAFWFLLVGLVAYVMLAGAEAAVVRAGLMGATVLIARQSGRMTTARNLIAMTAVVMLMINPRLLRDDVGFQLSMLATIGLTILAPRLGQRLEFLPRTFGIREALASTLAATIFTLPIIVFNFHQFPLISPIANLLILPLVPYAMGLSALAALAALIVPPSAPFIGGLAWGFLELMILIVKALTFG